MPYVTNDDGGRIYQPDPAPEGMMYARVNGDEDLSLVPDPNANKPKIDPNSLEGKANAYGFDLIGGFGMQPGQLGDIYNPNNTMGTGFLNDGRMYGGGEDAPKFIETSVITDGGYRVPLKFAEENGLNILGIAPPDVEHNGSSFDQFIENVVGPAMEMGIPIALAAGAGGMFGSGTGIPGYLGGAGETAAGTTAGTSTGGLGSTGLNYAKIGSGALRGAATSALTGGNPITGALTGGLSGGLNPIISNALKDIVPSSLIPTLTNAGTQLITTGGIDPTRLATNALVNTIGGGVDKTIDRAILPFFKADAGDDSVQVASGYGGTTDSPVGELLPGDEGYQYPEGYAPATTFADANTAQDVGMLGDDPLQVYKDLGLIAEDATDLSALDRPIAYTPGGGSINASDSDAYNANVGSVPKVVPKSGTPKVTSGGTSGSSNSSPQYLINQPSNAMLTASPLLQPQMFKGSSNSSVPQLFGGLSSEQAQIREMNRPLAQSQLYPTQRFEEYQPIDETEPILFARGGLMQFAEGGEADTAKKISMGENETFKAINEYLKKEQKDVSVDDQIKNYLSQSNMANSRMEPAPFLSSKMSRGRPTRAEPIFSGLKNYEVPGATPSAGYSARQMQPLRQADSFINTSRIPFAAHGGSIHPHLANVLASRNFTINKEMIPGPEGRYYAKHAQRGFAVGGAGTGQSDDIPTMLSDGEYVFDADTVAALGDGSTKAGSAVLDKMREAIRKHKRSAPVNDIPPKAKSPMAYLKMKQRK
jgi:hypothetical protein